MFSRFEIACYKNKVLAWREGAEKDLGEVLQIRQIFTNVSKGQFAKKEEISNAFEGLNIDQVIEFILKKGTYTGYKMW